MNTTTRHPSLDLLALARSIALAGILASPSLAASETGTTLRILPGDPVLSGPHASQRLVVDVLRGTESVADATPRATFTSMHPAIAAVNAQGVVTPVGDGIATIRASVDGQTAEVTITVVNAQQALPRSFRNDVQMVLTRAGCNMGACHGAQAGKKGFKLTLRGYDSEADHNTLTRQAKGRRVTLADPASSLLLLKATGVLPHGGGARFDEDSPEYRILADWVAEGAPPPLPEDPTVVALEVFPQQGTLKPATSRQLLVSAIYSNGLKRDVTHWAKFTSTEVGVATVDDEGHVAVAGHGEAAITVWFASKVALATISVPHERSLPAETFANSPRANLIDEHVLAKLSRLQIPPSGGASDSQFVRRAFLDTLGMLPTAAEAQRFLADTAPDKRSRLIDELFARPEFVDYWSYKWSDLLLVSTKKLKGPAVWSFYNWIRQSVETNRPWNEFAHDIVTARGSTLENGAANYFVLHKDPKLLTEATTLTFLGLSIGCAQCHDHPLERWTLDDYYGMASLFARVRTKDSGVEGESIVFAVPGGEIKHPTRVTTPVPRPLDGRPLPNDDPRDRREHLAAWLTDAGNPYFAKALVNRVWANYMGRGLVEMVDDLRATNPPSNEPLLAALAGDFVKSGYDVRHVMRLIMNSAAYQRSSRAEPENAADDRFYSHYLPRRMTAEVLLDALSQVTGAPTEFPDYPRGLRALQLPDANVNSYFLSAFGRPAREFTCECERSAEPSVTQSLHLANGATLNNKLKAPDNALARWLDAQKLTDAEILDQLYLSALSRPCAPAEKERLLASLAEAAAGAADDQARATARREAIEDIAWALLTSKEFLFVH